MISIGTFGLLAERSVLRDMGSGFREKREHFDATDLFFWFLIIIGIFVALAVLARILGRHDKHRLFNSSQGLFRSLCRAHELDRAARRLLQQIARAQGLNPPARIFLEPACFELARANPELEHRQGEIQRLARQLFAASEAAPAPSQPGR